MIPFKQWAHEEAARLGIKPNAIYNRVSRGRYPALKVKRVNGRLSEVEEGQYPLVPGRFGPPRKLLPHGAEALI